MRVTNNMLLSNYLRNISSNLGTVGKMQQQMASGKRITKISDDPIGVISSMQVRVKLYKSEQYKKNVDRALTWLDETESSILELNEVIKTAYETVVGQATDTMDEEERSAAAQLIKQLRDHVVTIGNAKSNDKYIFGGYNVSNAPFEVDASGNIIYNNLDMNDSANAAALDAMAQESIRYSVGFNITMDVSTTGVELLGTGDNNIYKILDDLYNALESNTSNDGLTGFTAKLQNKQNDVLSIAAEIGGKVNRLELIQNRFEEDILTYTDRKSKIEDVDQAEAIMNYKMAQSVYEASLQIGSQIIQPSLVNFLK
jgi:flagellar hook-associated protein 3 FlgL